MTPNNETQAFLPEGATLLPNPRGTACGFSVDMDSCRFYFLPGVPHEMHGMFERTVLPDLKKRLQTTSVQVARLSTFGLGESKIGHLLEGLEATPPGKLLIQYRAAMPEVQVRLCLSGYGPSDVACATELQGLEREAVHRLGDAVFSRAGKSLPEVVHGLLAEQGQRVAVAESCTGGLLAGYLTDVPGASKAFLGGIVAYANDVKISALGVDTALLQHHGAVSAPVAEAMARGVLSRFDADWAMSITGIAGPSGGTEQKPVGTVFLGLASKSATTSRALLFPGPRDRIRKLASYAALEMLRHALLSSHKRQIDP